MPFPRARAAALLLPCLWLLTACGRIEVPVFLNLDPAAANTLELGLPDGSAVSSDLSGGVATTLILDTHRLLTWKGVFATIRVDDVRIAGSSLLFFGAIPSGTLCLAPDPALASGGFAFLRPLRGEGSFQLTLETLAYLTDPVLAAAFPPLPFSAAIDDEVPLTISDLLAIVAGDLGVDGGLTIQQTLVSTLPPDTPLVGGSDVTVTATLTSASAEATGPLLDECDAFLAALP